MNEHYTYEAVGLRDTGDIFTVEILGRRREAVAVHTAQMWADQWRMTVNLYRVPSVRFGSRLCKNQCPYMVGFQAADGVR